CLSELGGMLDRLFGRVVQTAVREAVGRDVDDAHEERLVETEARERRPLGGDTRKESRKVGIAGALLGERRGGYDAALGTARHTLDQLDGRECDRPPGERQG